MGLKFLILGINNGGLFVARQIRKHWLDALIYAIGDPSHDIGRYSNVIDRFYGARTSEDVLESISQAYMDMGKGSIKAYMCSNPMLELLVLQHAEVFDYLDFENAIDVYRIFVDKAQTEQLCRKLKVPRPDEYSLIDVTHGSIPFPVVVKPLEKGAAIGASKCAYLSSQKQLDSYLSKTDSLGINRKSLVCQSLIVGDNRWEYGYGGFFIEGKAIVDVFFYQFRQSPQGLCCYAREISDRTLCESISQLVYPLLQTTKYNGFIEFDIKQDSETGRLFLLDVNPRPWRSVDILSVKLADSSVWAPHIKNHHVVWHYPMREIISFSNKMNVPYTQCKHISGYKSVKNYISLYDKHDVKPFIKQLCNDIKDLVLRII